MVCLTIFTEFQEWYTFLPAVDALAAANAWRETLWGEGTDHQIDISGVDTDGKAQRAIFGTEKIIGMTVSDASRWKKPSPPSDWV